MNSQTTLTEVNVSACLDSEHVHVLLQVEEKLVFLFPLTCAAASLGQVTLVKEVLTSIGLYLVE